MGWEFTYIDLYAQNEGGVANLQQHIASLGYAGWEPVGQIDFCYTNWGNNVTVPQLMFRRAIG